MFDIIELSLKKKQDITWLNTSKESPGGPQNKTKRKWKEG